MKTRFAPILMAAVLIVACNTSSSGASALPASASPRAVAAQTAAGIQPRDWKFAMAVGRDSPWTKGAQRFADLVGERTGGKIKITVFPDGQFGAGNQITEFQLLQSGAVQFTYTSSIILSSVDPRFNLFALPWLAPDFKKFEKVIDGPGVKIWDGLTSKGVMPLGGYSSSGYRQLTNSQRPVLAPNDVAGLKLRVPGSTLYQSIFTKLGSSPTSLAFGEVFGALQQGVVAGQENPISLIRVSKFYEVQKYLTVWNYSADVTGILMNKAVWDSLETPAQDILRGAAKDAALYHRQLQAASDADDLAFLRGKMQVVQLTEAQIQAFRDAVEAVYAEFGPTIGKDLVEDARRAGR